MDTLVNIVKMLGHENRRIDLQKIDCEGCELNVYNQFFAKEVNVAQLLRNCRVIVAQLLRNCCVIVA